MFAVLTDGRGWQETVEVSTLDDAIYVHYMDLADPIGIRVNEWPNRIVLSSQTFRFTRIRPTNVYGLEYE